MKLTLILCLLAIQLSSGQGGEKTVSPTVTMSVASIKSNQVELEIANKTSHLISIVEPSTERTSGAVSLVLFDSANHTLAILVRPSDAWQDGAFLPVIRVKPGNVHRFTIALADFNLEPHAFTSQPVKAKVSFNLRAIGLNHGNGFFEEKIEAGTFAVRMERSLKGDKAVTSLVASDMPSSAKASSTNNKSPQSPTKP